jgi:hypothetical protein
MRASLLTTVIIAMIGSCAAQTTVEYMARAILPTEFKADTLVDHASNMTFVLDSTRINITAYDSYNKVVWRTDPWSDNKLTAYRVARPTIVYYQLQKKVGFEEEVIWITYNNTQFGTVDKATGKFTWMGQD